MLRTAHARAGIVILLLAWGAASGSSGDAPVASLEHAATPGSRRAPRVPRPRSPQSGPKRQVRFRHPGEDGEQEDEGEDPPERPRPIEPGDARTFLSAADADQAVVDACAPPDAGQ